MGRVPRQRLQRVRDRGQGGDRRRVRAGRSRRPAPLRHHPGARPVHGAAGRARRLRPRRGPLHALRRRPVPASRAPVLATSIFQVPEHRIRVVAGDIGGAFGTKGWQYPEHRLVLWAARKLGRPVKWACERREAILADEHARDTVSEAELALDAAGAVPRAPGPDRRERRRLRVVGPQPARNLHERRHAGRRLHDPGRARPRHLRAGQHELHRAVSRRRPAGVDLRHRAAHRRRRPRARPGPGRAPADAI